VVMTDYTTKSVSPVWKQNYDLGWPFFQFTDNEFVSKGICWFTAWREWPIRISVSHCGVCVGPDECIEALAGGVKLSNLHDRFDDPHTHVFFRKPAWYDREPCTGRRLSNAAYELRGSPYAYSLIVAKAFTQSPIGRGLNRLFCGKMSPLLCTLAHWPGTMDCDGVVGRVIREAGHWEGCLRKGRNVNALTPQIIFEDQELFCPWLGARIDD